MKLNYRQKLTLGFCIIFAFFAIGIIVIQQSQVKNYKTEALEEKLDAYADIASNYIRRSVNEEEINFDSLLTLLPAKLRLTWIEKSGQVRYDNIMHATHQLENHAERPEVREAETKGKGIDIRKSASNQVEYLYYAKNYNSYFIRVALPYDIQTKAFLKPDNAFLYYILLLFLIGLVFINYVARYFGRTIEELRDFSVAITNHSLEGVFPTFSNDELGEIGEKIIRDYQGLKEKESKIALEREKLLQHIQSSAEGICFFTPARKVTFYNGLFLQFVNTILGIPPANISEILDNSDLAGVKSFLDNPGNNNYFETMLTKKEKSLVLSVNLFEDKSFEIIINEGNPTHK